MAKPKEPQKSNDPERLTFERPPQYYFQWQKEQGIPIHDTFFVESLAETEVDHWELFGGKGCFVNLTDSFLVGSFLLEIPPAGALRPMHHLFEGTVYVVEGIGETMIRQQGGPADKVTWRKHSLFAPPLNTTYQHRNLDPDRSARLLVVNNAPLIMSLFHDEDFVFSNEYAFTKRYRGEPDFFDGTAEYLGSRLSRVNYIEDIRRFELINWEMRGKGAKTSFLSLSDNTIAAHISSFEVGTYKKAHRHGAGAHVVMLNGEGYSLLWEDGKERERVDWKEGTMFAPPEWWWHQHFNTGHEPARYLAVRNNNPVHPLRMGLPRFHDAGDGVTQFGKAQIEFEEEDPEIYDEYAAELCRKGISIRQERPTYR